MAVDISFVSRDGLPQSKVNVLRVVLGVSERLILSTPLNIFSSDAGLMRSGVRREPRKRVFLYVGLPLRMEEFLKCGKGIWWMPWR